MNCQLTQLFFLFWLFLSRVDAEVVLEDVQQLFLSGEYETCLTQIQKARGDGETGVEWDLIKGHSQLALGQYKPALEEMGTGLRRHSFSLRSIWLTHEIYIHNGDVEQARAQLDRIYRLGGNFHINFWNPPDLVILGRTLLKLGAEPRMVLENFYDEAIKSDPNCIDAYIASGELALLKEDFGLAKTQFEKGLKRFPEEPALMLGMARAYFHEDRNRMLAFLQQTLAVNPRLAPARILLAEHLVDAEQFAAAAQEADTILDTNPRNEHAWACFALLAELRHDTASAKELRKIALANRPKGPRVDYFIGRKLSQKYLFKEGSDYQRKALEMDPEFLPAKVQLSQDLLRLGKENEGWKLAREVNEVDAYNVTAFNLTNLEENIAKFAIIENEHFVIRMEKKEAEIYGTEVEELLMEARSVLNTKYGLISKARTVVEIFPEQEDFAVRTFGMPGGAGYLGVCFGSLITANSPASIAVGGRHNWKAILWHEYCHVVTLSLTGNRIPRWLSEGISVHEEMKRNPAWGQHMDRRYQEIIKRGELTPVSQLTAAFMKAPNPVYMMFAYYESALVVNFIEERYGLSSIKNILTDLGAGVNINQAIENHTAHMEKIDSEFQKYAEKLAGQYAEKMDPETPGLEIMKDNEALSNWMNDHPDSLFTLSKNVTQLFKDNSWAEALPILERWIELNPDQRDAKENAYILLAEAYRKLNDPTNELATLQRVAKRSSDAVDIYNRMMELGIQKKDWPLVERSARSFLEVNPLVPDPHKNLGRSCEKQNKTLDAIKAYQNLLELDPTDPADVHFRLGRLLKNKDPKAARKQILQALEEAPRFRAAHKLLLEFPEKNGNE